jgi:predicted unusual protein kinase regulating ubiquinone biosynthesis (AarF/ABC1/UbiB family)
MISPVNIPLPELSEMTPERIQRMLRELAPAGGTDSERVRAIEQVLDSPAGEFVRREMGRWIVEQVVPVEVLVPEFYARWREPVREAMLFVVAHLSAARLAPKILEQVQLPPDTPAEERLLLLIAKVPGLQKLGQVIARNRNLSPALRRALSKLENGIRDVDVKDVCAEVRRELGTRLEQFEVEITPILLSEASVSAIVRFAWRNPAGGKRERGVFKVLKPHVPVFFAEDMEILQGLAAHFGGRHGKYGFAAHVLTDTFTKVRRLLEHEVDFPREQGTLLGECADYRAIPGVRVPTLISPLCTANVTAMTEEPGGKVTDATAGLPAWRRRRVAEQLTEAVLAAPLLSEQKDALFHADHTRGTSFTTAGWKR